MDSFDPYRKWLGIPPEEQPPNHYRLLGIMLFEDDPEVISNAADRQMAHVRSFQAGKHSALSQTLLNELSAARICLLEPAKRAAYDAQLRAELAQKAEAWSPEGPAFGYHLRGAFRYVVVQARRWWLSEMRLPEAYRALGRKIDETQSGGEETGPISLELQQSRAELAALRQQLAEPSEGGGGGGLKRLWRNLKLRWKANRVTQHNRALLAQLGRMAYQAGDPELRSLPEAILVGESLAHLERLRAEVVRLRQVPPNQLLSPERLAWIILGSVAMVVLFVLWLRWALS